MFYTVVHVSLHHDICLSKNRAIKLHIAVNKDIKDKATMCPGCLIVRFV